MELSSELVQPKIPSPGERFLERHPLHLYFLIWTMPFFLIQLGNEWIPSLNKLFVLVAAVFISFLLVLFGGIRLKVRDLSPFTFTAALLFLLWIFLSAFLGEARGEFLINAEGRYEGLIAYFCYFALFFIGRSAVQLRDSFFIQICFSSTVSAVLRIWEHYSRNAPTRLYTNSNWTDWEYPFATFGNPNFFASFLCVTLPVTVYLLTARKQYWAVLPLGVQLYALFINQSRSAMLGLLVSIPLFLILWAFHHPVISRKRVYLFILVFFLLLVGSAAALAIAFPAQWKRFSSIFQDALSTLQGMRAGKSLMDMKEGALRLPAWFFAFRLMATLPLFGTGLGAHFLVWKRFVRAHLGASHFLINYDRVHNEYLQIGAQSGLPSLVFWLAFVFSVLRSGSKRFARHPANILLFSTLIGYLVQAAFNISMAGSCSYFFLFLGILSRQGCLSDIPARKGKKKAVGRSVSSDFR